MNRQSLSLSLTRLFCPVDITQFPVDTASHVGGSLEGSSSARRFAGSGSRKREPGALKLSVQQEGNQWQSGDERLVPQKLSVIPRGMHHESEGITIRSGASRVLVFVRPGRFESSWGHLLRACPGMDGPSLAANRNVMTCE